MATEPLHVVEDGQAATTGSDLTIEKLSRESGMSVRNIRAHQARGLLQPPEVRNRVGFYGSDHVARLRLITELQADGFNLKGIERLLENASGRASEAMLDFRRAVTAPFETERPEIVKLGELRERFGESVNARNLARIVKLGLLVPAGPNSFEVPSPSLLRMADQVLSLGIPIDAVLDVVEVIQRSSGYTAQAFAQLFVEHVWQPFQEEGAPEERWGEVAESIERLRPLASEALIAVFQITMSNQVEHTFGKELARMGGDDRKRRGRKR